MMTIDELLQRIMENQETWMVDRHGHIRVRPSGGPLMDVCPITSLIRCDGGRVSAHNWEACAIQLGLSLRDADTVVTAADTPLVMLQGADWDDQLVPLRRRLLAACGLPAEEE